MGLLKIIKKTKQKEKEMETNIWDDISQYLSQVDGKIIFGQVSDSVLKTQNCKSPGYFIFVCDGCINNKIDNPVCCCLPCHKDAIKRHQNESYKTNKRVTRNNKRRHIR